MFSDDQQQFIKSVTDWKQEDYHGRHSTLLVTRYGERFWESWKWREEIQEPMELIDRFVKNGASKIDVYRLIASCAHCAERKNTRLVNGCIDRH